MSELTIMKEQIIAKYGRNSFEAGYIQHVFARRPAEYFKRVCTELLIKEAKKDKRGE